MYSSDCIYVCDSVHIHILWRVINNWNFIIVSIISSIAQSQVLFCQLFLSDFNPLEEWNKKNINAWTKWMESIKNTTWQTSILKTNHNWWVVRKTEKENSMTKYWRFIVESTEKLNGAIKLMGFTLKYSPEIIKSDDKFIDQQERSVKTFHWT